MDTKLTLKLNSDVIEEAKLYAKESNTSLSKFVENYLSAIEEEFKDFEDGIQYYTAIENKCDAIITRNKKNFKNSVIPVLNAAEILKLHN